MRSMRAYRANVTQRIFLSEITLPDAAAAFSRVTHDTPHPSSSSVDRDTQEEERNVWILSFFFHSLRVCMYSSQDVEPSFFSLSLHNWQSINLCIDDHDSTTSSTSLDSASPPLTFIRPALLADVVVVDGGQLSARTRCRHSRVGVATHYCGDVSRRRTATPRVQATHEQTSTAAG